MKNSLALLTTLSHFALATNAWSAPDNVAVPPEYPITKFTPLVSPAPRPSTGGLLVDSYGAVGDGKTDDLAAVREATKEAIKQKRPLLFSADKRYYLGNDEHSYYVFDLVNVEGLVVDGQGATLVLHQDMELGSFLGCRQLEVRNLIVDGIPRSVQGSLASGGSFKKGDVLESTLTLDSESDLLIVDNYMDNVRNQGRQLFAFDPQTMRAIGVLNLKALAALDRKNRKFTLVANVTDDKPVLLRAGSKISILPRLNKDKKNALGKTAGPRHGIYCVRCDDLVFRNLTLRDSDPIMAQACGKMVWDKVEGRPHADRLCGGTCHWHFNNPGPFLFQNCYLRGNADDTFSTVCRPLNIDARPDERSLVLSQPANLQTGDLIAFTADVTGEFIVSKAAKYKAESNKKMLDLLGPSAAPDWIGDAIVESAEPEGTVADPNVPNHWRCDKWKVTFKAPLTFLSNYKDADLKLQVRAIPWRSFHGNGVTVRDCEFAPHFRNGVTGGPINILYERVTIRNLGGGVGSFCHNIFNGLGPRNATWRDCAWIDTINHAMAWSVLGNTGWWSRNVEVTGCTITSPNIFKGAIFLNGISHVRVENNTIRVSSPGDIGKSIIEAGANQSGVGDDVTIRNNKITVESVGGKMTNPVISVEGANVRVNEDIETSNQVQAPKGVAHYRGPSRAAPPRK
jgi:hypothetical protein